MLDPKKIEEVASKISEALPKGVKQFATDAEKQVKQVVQNQLSKLDVVSQEEFDIQTQVLQRTREKLEALEKKVSEIEASLNSKD